MVLSLAFILAFIGSAVALLIGILIYSEVQGDMAKTFGDPLLINETNSTEFTNTTPIAHSYAEQTEAQTHTGNLLYTTIPNIGLSSGEFTAGNKYLIMFRADVFGTDDDFAYAFKSRHGSTDFVGSEKIFNPETASSGHQYQWFTVWTAVSGEGLTMQFRNVESSTKVVKADQITIVAIELEKFIENEDWFFDVRTTDDVLQCVVFQVTQCNPVGLWTQTNPSITLTTNGSDDWLVMATTIIDPESTAGDSVQSRINLDDTILIPLMRQADENSSCCPNTSLTRQLHFLARVYTPSDSSHTFENEASFLGNSALSPPIREHSQIFAINLDKFEFHADNYNGFFSPTTNSYKVPASGDPTPFVFESNSMTVDFDTTEDTFILSFNTMQFLNNGGGQFRQRMQVDDGSGTNFILDPIREEIYKDQPLGQTRTDTGGGKFLFSYKQGVNGDFNRWSMFTMLDLTTLYPLNNGAVSVDVDSVLNNFGANRIGDSQLVAFSMSAKTFEFQSQVPDSFNQASNIAFTVIGILPVALFFVLFAIFGGRTE